MLRPTYERFIFRSPIARPCIVAALLALLTPVAHAAPTFRTVALSEESAPGAGTGVTFSGFVAPILNSEGQTAFLADLNGTGVDGTNDRGNYSEGTGTLSQLARTGEQAPGAAAGVTFNYLNMPVLNGAGQAAFRSFLTGPGVDSTNDLGIYSNGGGTLTQVARTGNQAPGAASGVTFEYLHGPVFNSAGQSALQARHTGAGVDSTNLRGIYSDLSGTLTRIAGDGDTAPNTATGVKFIGIGRPTLNDAGQVAFSTSLTGPGVDNSNNSAAYSGAAGTLALVAREGEQAPGAATGVTFSTFHPVTINSTGQTAFHTILTGTGVDSTNDTGIYSEGAGALAKVARKGDQVPGAASGVTFHALSSSPVMNSAGHTAFRASLTGTGIDNTNSGGIYSEGTGTLTEVARAGNQAPSAPNGVAFDSLNYPGINGAGQTVFLASLTGANVDSTNDEGIYATDLDGVLTQIVREGELFDVDDDPLVDDLRTIASLNLWTGSGGEDGSRTSFNDQGQLAFQLEFTDGTEGIFVSNAVAIPEPASAVLMGIGALLVLPRRRGRGRTRTSTQSDHS